MVDINKYTEGVKYTFPEPPGFWVQTPQQAAFIQEIIDGKHGTLVRVEATVLEVIE